MRSWEPRGPRKRRTRQHVIADLSINHVERFVLRCGWTIQRTSHDYGIDLTMETYNLAGEPENGRVLFQVKATDKLQVRDKKTSVTVRVEWRDVEAWRTEPMPVILVLYDASEDQAFWVHVQACFAGARRRRFRSPAATTTVSLPYEQVVNESAMRLIASLRDDTMKRIWRVLFHEK